MPATSRTTPNNETELYRRGFVAAQVHWFRVKDGKLAEHWAVCDDLTTMLQLGILQPRPANNEPSAAVGVAEMPEDPSLSRDQARGIGQHSGWTDTLHDTPLARAGY